VLTTLKYFREEYDAHIKDKRCPAGVCKELITYSVDFELCDECGGCFKVCPTGAVVGEGKRITAFHEEKCIKCGACLELCKPPAIKVS